MGLLEELAVRCEAATGADRRLDYEIMTATVPVGGSYRWDPDDQNYRYTSSVDAAVSLVPDRWNWMVGRGRAYVENDKPAFIGVGTRPNPNRIWFEVRADPARALTAASLRARNAIALSEGSDR